MNSSLDIDLWLANLKETKPPYKCPFEDCEKLYKSYGGITSHMHSTHYDYKNVGSPSPSRKSKNSKKLTTSPDTITQPRDTLTYADAQKIVEIELDGKIHRLNIYEMLNVVSQENIDNMDNAKREQAKEMLRSQSGGDAEKREKEKEKIRLPEPSFRIIENYQPCVAPSRTQAYFRYMEKSPEDLDEMVEYDMDEEDFAWLQLINETRANESVSLIDRETFELLIDRFEKEAAFQNSNCDQKDIDDDALCCICLDGECQNMNMILFCDMCNLAVHQECYGVPYIPEGQWLCRRCLQSPSRAVECCLCPNKGGAFKQTDDGRWAHVVCALWIPEIGFANTVFLEPIDSIDRIPPARWKLTCYICKQRNIGACIQCHKTNCYTAFHVTCAQHAGLYMKIEPVRESADSNTTVGVRKTAYCDVHSPADCQNMPMIDNGASSEEDRQATPSTPAQLKAKSRNRMRKARKVLAERRAAAPVISIPVLTQKRVSVISSKINVHGKKEFMQKLLGYWTLKRQSRNGVPLLRRLQSNHMNRIRDQKEDDDTEEAEMKQQLKYWQRLRHDLEKARLLVELIRKREKIKRDLIKIKQKEVRLRMQPLNTMLLGILDRLKSLDTNSFFAEPVSEKEAPQYRELIEKPMDFSTMHEKIETNCYLSIDDFEEDFSLIIKNCTTYNDKYTIYYRAALKLRDSGGTVIRAAKRQVAKIGYDKSTGLHLNSPPSSPVQEEIDVLDAEARSKLPMSRQLDMLLDKLDEWTAKPQKKGKQIKLVKKEINKLRRAMAAQKRRRSTDGVSDSSEDDDAYSPGVSGDEDKEEDKTLVAEDTDSEKERSTRSRRKPKSEEKEDKENQDKSCDDTGFEVPLPTPEKTKKKRGRSGKRTTRKKSTTPPNSQSISPCRTPATPRTPRSPQSNFCKSPSRAPSSPTPNSPSISSPQPWMLNKDSFRQYRGQRDILSATDNETEVRS
ncbi:DgyrCDS4186 [Dimorphilus gyrociliatus]|uniref:DgyrCDS4186 n=1 Tax=Dimorphilus gyrociliatus TaxID=2664684 RepID=A0A7I8VHN9_9ANNE|nr:DgyrCDS4186 [Dimorphilus gyrociliatus]